jgi:hypothetical protein
MTTRVRAYDVMLDFFQCIISRRGIVAEVALNALVRLRLSTLLTQILGWVDTHS